MHEDRLHISSFRPPMPYRIDRGVRDRPPECSVAREEQVRSGGSSYPDFFSASTTAPVFLLPSPHSILHCAESSSRDLAGQRLRGNDVHGLATEEIAHFGLRQHLLEQVVHLVDLGEPLQDRDEPLVLPDGRYPPHDVVVEKVLAGPGVTANSSGPRVDQDRPQLANLGVTGLSYRRYLTQEAIATRVSLGNGWWPGRGLLNL